MRLTFRPPRRKRSRSQTRGFKKLAKALMRGENGSVYIHSKDSLDDRALVRHRATIVKLSGGIKSRIKHLLYNNGVEYPEEYFRSNRHWTRSFITWLQNDVRLLSDTDDLA